MKIVDQWIVECFDRDRILAQVESGKYYLQEWEYTGRGYIMYFKEISKAYAEDLINPPNTETNTKVMEVTKCKECPWLGKGQPMISKEIREACHSGQWFCCHKKGGTCGGASLEHKKAQRKSTTLNQNKPHKENPIVDCSGPVKMIPYYHCPITFKVDFKDGITDISHPSEWRLHWDGFLFNSRKKPWRRTERDKRLDHLYKRCGMVNDTYALAR